MAEKVEEAAKRQKKEMAAAGHSAQHVAEPILEADPVAEIVEEDTPLVAEAPEEIMEKNNDTDQK